MRARRLAMAPPKARNGVTLAISKKYLGENREYMIIGVNMQIKPITLA
jgi:hypothetical protein